jgi:phosphoglycerate kinase
MAAELDALAKALSDPARPMLAIVGGAKVSTKLGVLTALVKKVDRLAIGGAMANTFLLARGVEVGKSPTEPALLDEARAILASGKVLLPQDVLVADGFEDEWPRTRLVGAVGAQEVIVDIGPRTCAAIEAELARAGTILWNGPLGRFERLESAGGTRRIAAAIADAKGYSIAGGGDTAAALAQFGLEKRLSYVSSGGGAFLEYVAGKPLPAVEALRARAEAPVLEAGQTAAAVQG